MVQPVPPAAPSVSAAVRDLVARAAPPDACLSQGEAAPRRLRHHEWTPAKMAAFLRELKASWSVSAAAASVGMSRQSAYKLRRRLAGQPFDRAWEMALEPIRLRDALEPVGERCPVCGHSGGGGRLFRR